MLQLIWAMANPVYGGHLIPCYLCGLLQIDEEYGAQFMEYIKK